MQIHVITGCAKSVKFLFLKKARSHGATIKVKLLKALSYTRKEIFIKQNTQYTFTLTGMVQQKKSNLKQLRGVRSEKKSTKETPKKLN